jgi:hypothetical protein
MLSDSGGTGCTSCRQVLEGRKPLLVLGSRRVEHSPTPNGVEETGDTNPTRERGGELSRTNPTRERGGELSRTNPTRERGGEPACQPLDSDRMGWVDRFIAGVSGVESARISPGDRDVFRIQWPSE